MAAVRISPGVYEVNGKRINATTAAEAEKMASGKTAAPSKPATSATGKIDVPKKITNVKQGINAEQTVQNAQAVKNTALANPNINTDFGSQSVTYDANGNPVVTQKLSDDQKGIVDRDAQISKMGRDMALSLSGQGNLGQAFNPTLDARVGSGDLIADRKRQESELANYLARDLDTNYAKDKDKLEQQLYSRGIPLDPNNQQYQDFMKELDDNYSRQKADIRAQSLQFGGSEMDRTYGMNEQTRANQFNEQAGIRNQQLGEISNWSGLGTGAYIPQFQQYQGAQVNYGSPNDINSALTTARQNAQQLRIAQQAANRVGGGSSGGGTSTQSSPFVTG